MKKLIRWLKTVNQNAKARAELILMAKEKLACMDELWRRLGEESSDDVALLLMRLGQGYINILYQAQMQAQNVIRARQAPLN